MEVLKTNFPLDGAALVVLPLQASRNDSFLATFLAAELADRYGVAPKTEHLATLPAGRRAILMGSIQNPLVKDYCSRHHLKVTDRQPGPEGYVLQVSSSSTGSIARSTSMRAIRGSAASRTARRCSKYTARLEPCTCGWRSLELTLRGWEEYIIERPYTKNLLPSQPQPRGPLRPWEQAGAITSGWLRRRPVKAM